MSFGFMVRPPSLDAIQVIKRRSLKQFGDAVAKAADQTAATARERIKIGMKGARLGKLSNVVRYTSDVKKRRVRDIRDGNTEWRAGAAVFSDSKSERTSGALAAYTQGTVSIVPRRGRWLAIATDEIPRLAGKKRMTPALYERNGYDRKIGELEFIPGKKAGEAFLIVRDVQVNAARGFGRAQRVPKTGRVRAGKKKVGFIVAFILIKRTVRQQRINPKAIFRAEFEKMPARITANLRGKSVGSVRGKPVASWSGSFTL